MDNSGSQIRETSSGWLAKLDHWMAASPMHPRLVPFFVYICLLALIGFARDWLPASYPLLYVPQCLLVAWLLWRYRHLTPELNIRFHWLAIPTAIGLTIAWIALGWAMAGEFVMRWQAMWAGQPLGMIDYSANSDMTKSYFASDPEHFFKEMLEAMPIIAGISLGVRLLGMSLLVPFFEELFVRSLCVRSFQRFRPTMIGIVQVLEDMPLIGEHILHSRLGKRVAGKPQMFGKQFRETPVGQMTVFAVFASTLIFMLSHIPRDYLGCIVCGVTWCLLLWWTNRPALGERKMGLGPIIWSHGLVNAMLWTYCVYTGDWQFM